MNTDELFENFELLDDWEDKYRYLIDLGEKLPPLEEKYKSDEWLVSGCLSQVWLVPQYAADGKINFAGDSDAMIVRGLLAVVLMLLSGKTAAEISAFDAESALARLGLAEHLSPSRRNGLGAMLAKIRFYAEQV